MSSKSMSLKGKIKNYAKKNNITAQVVLQNYMFERFLERLSLSEYKDKFVVKGGMLIASLVGLSTRSTMDLDTTLKDLPLTEKQIINAISSICDIQLNDNVHFNIASTSPIRKDDIYGGYCVRLDAIYDNIVTPLTIDISTGDIITPNAVQYEVNGVFDDSLKIKLWGYNIETILAEKVETILNRSIFSTRPRDYYDVYILTHTQSYDENIFVEALEATAKHRGSLDRISSNDTIIYQIENSEDLRLMWYKYQRKFYYAREISYEDIIASLKRLLSKVKQPIH